LDISIVPSSALSYWMWGAVAILVLGAIYIVMR
jgi:hypothetical protein